MSSDAFPHLERAVAAQLGITPKDLRGIRAADLTRGEDWEIQAGAVAYSVAGVARLAQLLDVQADGAGVSAAGPEKNPPEDRPAGEAAEGAPPLGDEGEAAVLDPLPGRALGAVEDLVCGRCYRPNRKMVEAMTPDGELVLVRVRDNSNLQAGMVMKCRFAGSRIWELAQRLPRKRGKW